MHLHERDPLQSILVMGDADTARTAKFLLDSFAAAGLTVHQCVGIDGAPARLTACSDVALILLLWQGGDHAQLMEQVRALFDAPAHPRPSIMVRCSAPVTPQCRAALWQLGVADLLFNQPTDCAELLDSVAVALRQHQRQRALTDIPGLARSFSDARSLRDLACLSLQAVHSHGLPVRDGLFCVLDSSAACRPMIIAGSGAYDHHACSPLDGLQASAAKHLLEHALTQRRSQFRVDGAVIMLNTPGGRTACMYFTLDGPLSNWCKELLGAISDMIATAVDQNQLAHRLLRTQQATVTTLSELAEHRDAHTGKHIARVARMTTEIAQVLFQQGTPSIDAGFLDQIGLASILHDTGKIGSPDHILNKAGPLAADERRIIEQHVVLGHRILLGAAQRAVDSDLLMMAAEIARHHHERFDGRGYPDGLKGEEIPLCARIVALVDVYDALISQRPYKAPWSHDVVVEKIRLEAGRQFDPLVVDAFLRLEDVRMAARRIEWNPAMSVNHADLDADHQQLIEIINRLWMADGMGNRQIMEFILDDLVCYTEYHFAREECLMAQIGFPDVKRHQRIHAGICQRLRRIRSEYFQGIRDQLRSELLEFVTEWLNTHILEEDMQFSHFLSETEASTPDRRPFLETESGA